VDEQCTIISACLRVLSWIKGIITIGFLSINVLNGDNLCKAPTTLPDSKLFNKHELFYIKISECIQ
jgi:hypothetical protein